MRRPSGGPSALCRFVDGGPHSFWLISPSFSCPQCIYLLVLQLLSAEQLCEQYASVSTAVAQELSSYDQAETGTPSPADLDVQLLLQAAASTSVQQLQMLQQPVFDMLRCIFSR